jgi:glutamine synthetase
MPKSSEEVLSPLGNQYLGGLLHHALASTVLANPTVNAYRRFRISAR